MSTNLLVVKSMADALDVLSKNVVPLEKSDFNELGAYVYPLRSQVQLAVELELDGKPKQVQLTREDGVIINLRLPDELELFQMLEPKYGPLEHGGIEKQLQACYHQDQRYKDNVLVLGRFSVRTGEMGIKTGDGHEFYRIIGKEPPNSISAGDYGYDFARQQMVPMPNRRGYFDRIGKTEAKGYWGGVDYEDDEGRSAVRCYWVSAEEMLYVNVLRPLERRDTGAVAAWRKAA
ncbi:MAG: hypothetical protein HYT70_04090 [Candidatus Aenigmarchaeota archaeon]|nr:hypothetical protein [Candidatus Aenigmarchaeota archaeon]